MDFKRPRGLRTSVNAFKGISIERSSIMNPTQENNQKPTFCYVRVSTTEQIGGAESQTRALSLWCERNNIKNFEFFTDHGVSGAKESRPALNRMMEKIEAGIASQVIVFQFSRFARSTTHLLKALEKFREKQVRFISITEAVDTQSAMGVVLFTILGALAQLERELIRERVRAGLANARAKGKLIGRTRKRNSALIESLLEAGLSYREIARIAKCSHGSVHQQYRVKKICESESTRYETRHEEKCRLKTEKALADQKIPDEVSLNG
jgi:DNA invertase Pin-like site-specific DNA recombinase